VLTFVRDSVARGYKFWITTPNPEIILAAQKDKILARAIENSDMALPDGVGLAQAAKFLELPNYSGNPLRPLILFFQGLYVGLATFINKKWLFSELRPIKGREMFIELVRLANKKRWKVFLFGGETGEARLAGQNLRKNFKRVRIAVNSGPAYNDEAEPVSFKDLALHKEVLAQINEFAPQVVFVALGAPKQEKWVYKNLPRLKVGGAAVVGGAFNYLAGNMDLPPKWMSEAGLEWLWRLITQPNIKRIKRVLTAFPVFPLRVFWLKLTSK
jgi:N-acetylglucosaminyldiphosphoundecaprenol N-acetyl-beta-D-mannosaminyltransferase